MKKFFTIAIMMMVFMSSSAQVEFTKFKLSVANLYNFSQKMLDLSFKVTSDKNLKYVKVTWSGVNEVGDAIVSEVVGGVNANTKHTKFKIVECTGPFESKKKYTRHASPYYYKQKNVVPFPVNVVIDYMGGGSDTINITKDNIKTYFPSVKWIDVDYKSGL